MMKYIAFIPLFLFIYTQHISACMPQSQDDIFIARYQSIQKKTINSLEFNVGLSEQKFIFRKLYQRFTMGSPEEIYSEFKPQGLEPNNLVIGLAYAPDGGKPEIYTLLALARLNCKDDQLFIGKTLGSFLAWDRKEQRCKLSDTHSIGILDGFLDYDQSHYVKQLQNQYPTCQELETAFPKLKASQSDIPIFQKMYRWVIQWL